MRMVHEGKAGGPAGLVKMTEELFAMPMQPTILRSDALGRLRRLLSERKVEAGAISLSDEPVRRGVLFDAGGKRVDFPIGPAFERAWVALVDLDPAARWAHPAMWAFIPVEGGDTPIELPRDEPPRDRDRRRPPLARGSGMKAHAVLWCGLAVPRTYDFAGSVHDLAIACKVARALGIAPADIHAFVPVPRARGGVESDPRENDLLPPEFHGKKYGATRAELRRVLQGLPRGNALLFIATNHGDGQGLLTSEIVDELEEDDYSPLKLSPRELDEMLDGWQGPQVLVIAACYAGIFLDIGSANRMVIAACSEKERYYLEGMDRRCSPLLPVLFGAWTGTTFDDQPPLPLEPSLTAAFEAAKVFLENGYEGDKTTVPLRNGEVNWPALGGP